VSDAPDTLDLIAYTEPHWLPFIRPAPLNRRWMDESQDRFAYRCLPMALANTYGWEILNPARFAAIWDGGKSTQSVYIFPEQSTQPLMIASSHFGSGVLTFNLSVLFRTPPGWNLMMEGPRNDPKDGIGPLSGLIETDWAVYTATMNWRFTRPGPVVFEAGEPICLVSPQPRGMMEQFVPSLRPMSDDPYLREQYLKWSASRDDFNARGKAGEVRKTAREQWQGNYFRGENMDKKAAADHQTRLRLREFEDRRK
jgi:hypothetical protein